MSQGDLAKKLGVCLSYVNQIKRSVQNISLKKLEKLEKLLAPLSKIYLFKKLKEDKAPALSFLKISFQQRHRPLKDCHYRPYG